MLKNITRIHADFVREFAEANRKNADGSILSFTCAIESVSPIGLYAASAHQYRGDRFFWRSQSNGTILIGLGSIKQFEDDHTRTRAVTLGRGLQEIWSRMTIAGSGVANANPIVFGGFSYDPLYKMSGYWSEFENSQWRVPAVFFTLCGETSSVTFNVTVSDYGSAEDAWDNITTVIRDLAETSTGYVAKSMLLGTKLDAPESWKRSVDKAVNKLRTGSLRKVTLARSMEVIFANDVHAEDSLPTLLEQQDDTHVFALEAGDCAFVGASPRLLFRKNNDEIVATCLAGSISRGSTEEQDLLLGEQLLSDVKNTREHELSVKAMHKKLSSFAEVISLPEGPTLMKLKDIQHLYTPIFGKVHPKSSAIEFIDVLLYGENSELELELVRDCEQLEKGLYGGPIGWIDCYGNGEIAIALRCGLLHHSKAYLYAGCGIIEDSDADEELTETVVKFKTMLESFR